jgi:hypothetical protein
LITHLSQANKQTYGYLGEGTSFTTAITSFTSGMNVTLTGNTQTSAPTFQDVLSLEEPTTENKDKQLFKLTAQGGEDKRCTWKIQSPEEELFIDLSGGFNINKNEVGLCLKNEKDQGYLAQSVWIMYNMEGDGSFFMAFPSWKYLNNTTNWGEACFLDSFSRTESHEKLCVTRPQTKTDGFTADSNGNTGCVFLDRYKFYLTNKKVSAKFKSYKNSTSSDPLDNNELTDLYSNIAYSAPSVIDVEGYHHSSGLKENDTYIAGRTRDGSKYTHVTQYNRIFSPNEYTVTYHGNGYTSGSMEGSHHTYDTEENLRNNGFVKEYTISYDTGGGSGVSSGTYKYTFKGWSLSRGGKVEYDDGEAVNNLTAEDGDTFHLYAVWDCVPQNITSEIPTRENHQFVG